MSYMTQFIFASRADTQKVLTHFNWLKSSFTVENTVDSSKTTLCMRGQKHLCVEECPC